MEFINFVVYCSATEHPDEWTVSKLRCKKRVHQYFLFILILELGLESISISSIFLNFLMAKHRPI